MVTKYDIRVGTQLRLKGSWCVIDRVADGMAYGRRENGNPVTIDLLYLPRPTEEIDLWPNTGRTLDDQLDELHENATSAKLTEYDNAVNAAGRTPIKLAEALFNERLAMVVTIRMLLDPNRNEREKTPFEFLTRNEKPFPPSPREQPVEHIARLMAAGMLIQWCQGQGIVATRRTVPPITRDHKPHPFLLQEIYVDVYL